MNVHEVQIRLLTEYSTQAAEEIGQLVPEINEQDDGRPVSEQYLNAIIESPDRDQFVAELHGKIIGAATLNLIIHPRKRKGWLDYIMVRSEYQGQGVGYKMWQSAEKWCVAQGAEMMDWTTSNIEAMKFYERQGAIRLPGFSYRKYLIADE